MKTAKTALALLLLLAVPSLSEDIELVSRDAMEITSASERRQRKRTKSCGNDFKEKGLAYPAASHFAAEPSNKRPCWSSGRQTRKISLSFSCTNIRFALRRELWGPSAALGTNRCRRAFTNWNWFNPQSNFFLSLHISYPNASDRILGLTSESGCGDIFSSRQLRFDRVHSHHG